MRTRFNEGGARAVADYGRRGGWTVRSPKLVARLAELFGKGLGPRPAHAAVAKHVGAHQDPRDSGRLAGGMRIGRKLAEVSVHG